MVKLVKNGSNISNRFIIVNFIFFNVYLVDFFFILNLIKNEFRIRNVNYHKHYKISYS